MKTKTTKKKKKQTTLKKTISIIAKTFACIIVFVLLWVLAAFLLPKIKVNKDFISCSGDDCIVMYLRSNGMHTDVVFPVTSAVKDWRDEFPIDTFEGVDSTFNYIAIGWGDKGFYLDTPTWADLKISTALKATVGVSGSAIHVTYLSQPPSTTTEYGKQLVISKDQYLRMLTYVDNAMVKSTDKRIILIPHPAYDTNDNYYEALGSYSLFKTCNVWTNRCLKQAGIQNGLWTPTANGVMNSSPR